MTKEAEGMRTAAHTEQRIPCTLMHKRVPVAALELDGETGLIRKIGDVESPDHLPVGVGIKQGRADRAALNAWWADRCIPASRAGVRKALETLRLRDTTALLPRALGLSLADPYWVRPADTALTWEQVNFYRNAFPADIGDVLFGAEKEPDGIDYRSPDITTDGNLQKRWAIVGGRRCLIKGGSGPFFQQPLSEVVAARICERLGIPCAAYSVVWENGAPYSVCEDLTDENTELIPAWRIIQTQKKSNNTSYYTHFINCAGALGIPGVTAFLDRMIVLDHIIANEDRHLNNFGALRNAETLEWLGMAPIYDSGSSLGYDKSAPQMRSEKETVCKPFKARHADQLRLVSSFGWIDFGALSDVKALVTESLSDERAEPRPDADRIRVIAELTEKRVREIKRLAEDRTPAQPDSTAGDVQENVAADYLPRTP